MLVLRTRILSMIKHSPTRVLNSTYYLLSLYYATITFLTMFILTSPVNFPGGKKPERPEKTHDFRQSVDRLFSHESVARIEPTISEVKVGCFKDWTTANSIYFSQKENTICVIKKLQDNHVRDILFSASSNTNHCSLL